MESNVQSLTRTRFHAIIARLLTLKAKVSREWVARPGRDPWSFGETT